MNQNQNTSNQSKQGQSSGNSSLANKSQNDQMMASLKDIDAKLEADGKSEGEKSSRKQAGGRASDEKRKPMKAVKGGEMEQGDERELSEEGEGSEKEGAGSFKSMSFELNKAVDLTKTYLAKDKTLPYLGKLGSEVGEQVVEYVQDWAGKNNAKIDVNVVGIQGQTTATYGGVGAAAGAGLGYAFGGKAGGIVGLIFGAAIGTAASCVKVSFKMDEESEGKQAPMVQ